MTHRSDEDLDTSINKNTSVSESMLSRDGELKCNMSQSCSFRVKGELTFF